MSYRAFLEVQLLPHYLRNEFNRAIVIGTVSV